MGEADTESVTSGVEVRWAEKGPAEWQCPESLVFIASMLCGDGCCIIYVL